MNLEDAVSRYEKQGLPERNMEYLAEWVYHVYKDYFHLPSVDEDQLEKLATDKTKLSIFAILIDDLADNTELRDGEKLENALNIVRLNRQKYDNRYLQLAHDLWDDVRASVSSYPRGEEFFELYLLDVHRFLNSIEYGYLDNKINLTNELEDRRHKPPNMMIKPFLDLDLMASPRLEREYLNKIRPVFFHAEDICHVGNILSTWEREVHEEDFSSPLIAKGLREGLVDKKEVKNEPRQAIEKLRQLEEVFEDRVQADLQEVKSLEETIPRQQLDISVFHEQLEETFKKFLNRDRYWE